MSYVECEIHGPHAHRSAPTKFSYVATNAKGYVIGEGRAESKERAIFDIRLRWEEAVVIDSTK